MQGKGWRLAGGWGVYNLGVLLYQVSLLVVYSSPDVTVLMHFLKILNKIREIQGHFPCACGYYGL